MTLLDNLVQAAENLEKHCGVYDINILNYGIDDNMNMFWYYEEENEEILFSEDALEVEEETGNYYAEQVRYIFQGEIYTIVLMDNACGGDDFISIFNTKNKLKL